MLSILPCHRKLALLLLLLAFCLRVSPRSWCWQRPGRCSSCFRAVFVSTLLGRLLMVTMLSLLLLDRGGIRWLHKALGYNWRSPMLLVLHNCFCSCARSSCQPPVCLAWSSEVLHYCTVLPCTGPQGSIITTATFIITDTDCSVVQHAWHDLNGQRALLRIEEVGNNNGQMTFRSVELDSIIIIERP